MALQRAIPKIKSKEASNNDWILESIWRLISERVSALRDPARDQAIIRHLVRVINTSLEAE